MKHAASTIVVLCFAAFSSTGIAKPKPAAPVQSYSIYECSLRAHPGDTMSGDTNVSAVVLVGKGPPIGDQVGRQIFTLLLDSGKIIDRGQFENVRFLHLASPQNWPKEKHLFMSVGNPDEVVRNRIAAFSIVYTENEDDQTYIDFFFDAGSNKQPDYVCSFNRQIFHTDKKYSQYLRLAKLS